MSQVIMARMIMYEPFQPTVAERLFGHGYAKFWAIAREKAFEMDVPIETYLSPENKFIVLTDCALKQPRADLKDVAGAIEEVVPALTFTEEEVIMFLPEYLDHVDDLCTDFASREP